MMSGDGKFFSTTKKGIRKFTFLYGVHLAMCEVSLRTDGL